MKKNNWYISCEICGREFIPAPGKSENKGLTEKFCSKECWRKPHSKVLSYINKKNSIFHGISEQNKKLIIEYRNVLNWSLERIGQEFGYSTSMILKILNTEKTGIIDEEKQ